MNSQNFKNGIHRFPVSTESLEFLQQQIYLAARLSSIAGTNVIVKQPTSSTLPGAQTQLLSFDSQYSPFAGLVIIDGLLYPLYGDKTKSHISISTKHESVQVPGEQNPLQVRTYRYAYYGSFGTYNKTSFTTIDNIVTIMSRIATIEGAYMTETDIRALVSSTQNTLQTALNSTNGNLSALANRVGTIENNYKTASEINELLNANARHHLPQCSVIDWFCSGYIKYSRVPYGFVPCGKVIIGQGISASSLSLELGMWRSEFPDIQISSGTVTKSSTSYTYIQITKCNGIDIPDLTDRFVVQAGYSYDKFGTGGTDGTVTLEIKNMPSHKHDVSLSGNGAHQHYMSSAWNETDGGTSPKKITWTKGTDDSINLYTNSGGGTHSHTISEVSKGSGEAFSVMPPYFALYKLIKVI
jgi:hypothetical protein